MRWHYRDPLLVWLLPSSYALHIAEEWFGGFPEWIARVVGAPLPRAGFMVINTIAMAVMIAATAATARRESNGWMGIAIATVLLVNGIAHLGGSLLTRTYSPGLVTGVVLYLPIASLVLLRAWPQATTPMFARGIAAGVVIHVVVFLLAAVMASA